MKKGNNIVHLSCASFPAFMKILQLTKKFPFPLLDGESVAVHYLSKALHQLGCQISLCSMNTTKHYSDPAKLPPDYAHYVRIETVEVDNRVNPKDAFLNLFSGKSYHVSRFESRAFADRLARMISEEHFDLILLETLYLTPYIPLIRKLSTATIVMRSHNLEYEIWERMLKNMPFSLQKIYLIYLVRKLKRYELAHLNDYDALITVTQRDLSNYVRLGYQKKGIVVPIGIDTRDYTPIDPLYGDTLHISFLGSLDWMPNMEGISWFLKNVWKAFQDQLQGAELHIAGRNTPAELLQYRDHRTLIHGEVADARKFILSCDIMIVPLFSGSGMRVKILEAMALGRVVITTSLGLEGISARDSEHVLIADTAVDFVEKIRFCMQNHKILDEMGKRARALIEKEYDNSQNALKLTTYMERLVNQMA